MVAQEPANPQFFTLQQVAEIMQLPYDVVRDNVYKGRWPHREFSPRNRRMSQEDIDWVSENTKHTPLAQSRSETRRRNERIKKLMRSVA